MLVERWNLPEHAPLYVGWLRARKMGNKQAHDLALRWLPPTGFVVGQCVAGFLYKTDALQAYVGAIAGDPNVAKDVRRKALDALLSALTKEARHCGFEAVTGLPTVASLAKVFSDSGFILAQGHYAIRRV